MKKFKEHKLRKRIIVLISVAILLAIVIFLNKDKTINLEFITSEFKNNVQSAIMEEQHYIEDENNMYIYSNTYKFNIDCNKMNENNEYKVVVNCNNNISEIKLDNTNQECSILLNDEGKNTINISLYENSTVIEKLEKTVYYIKPYKEQFTDKLSMKGIHVHYISSIREEYEWANKLLSCLGINYVRTDFWYKDIAKDKEVYNYRIIDRWLNDLNTYKHIKVLGVLDYYYDEDEENKLIDSEDEENALIEFYRNLKNKYPMITDYEIINEANTNRNGYDGYITDETIKWYADLLYKISNEDSNINIYSSGTSTSIPVENTRISSEDFYKGIIKYNNTHMNFSVHPYDHDDINELKQKVSSHKEVLNDAGGFNYLNVTEYGTTIYNVTEEEQSNELVKQSVILDEDCKLAVMYNFRTTGDENSYEQFGIIRKDNTPRPSYYAMKNYYENTNGSEYIGTINLADGLEAHVYDKDGKPKIITWSNTKDQTIQIDYANFTAKDLYGNDIENTNGKLDITTSPVYLDNISTKYFYEAISNTALEKYSEFEEKFAKEIASVDGLQENIDTLKQYLESISNIENESEETAKQKMKEHFNLGNQILTAYKDKALDVEYVKLSSMLDMLNEIGDSFEDLVTVTAKTRNPDLENTKTLMDNTEQEINNNNDLDIVYPEKILEYSKDLYEDSEYINNLEEENDIKTGLIVSYDLHAKYLADWANTFANIYIDEYIEENPVTESYSATSLTNQDVTVTLNIPQDVKITNNEGSNTYTFTENGTFTFEYERRGKTDSKLVSVNYIDKTPPEITNVENGEVYTQSITPNASDEHLDKVQLTFKGQVIEDYEVGDELAEEGEYKLTATDIVGNTSTVKFYIMKEDSTYKIKESNILNISPETKIKDFKDKFTVMEGYTIKHENTELTEEDAISTGDILEETDGNKFTLIVKGDLNCDGRLSIVDLSIERKYLLEIIDIDENQKLSSDMNIDGETSLMDLSIMRKTLLGIIE